jgi:hypothetical protein
VHAVLLLTALRMTGHELFDLKLKTSEIDCATNVWLIETDCATNLRLIETDCATNFRLIETDCPPVQADTSQYGNFIAHCSFRFILSLVQ